ncbi:NAD(P)H-binding protein [Rhodococcus sp. IEGM 1408]|uniref:NAD(P)H-binding protein n=1 Tax=Rhodococcus sp. IEGM 1408 TaxID=3082220 RepID=UPI002952B11D|nr:NAD(P)H-binding protein [Rhodococcus sp. IEGM 1408]MDV7999955.1 NAD(P)H-binding protein [Rhodococcus sp. IEGM 1408]
MTVLVVGSGGYVGSRLVPALLDRGHRVRAGFTDPGRASGFEWAGRVRPVRCDVLDPSCLADALDGADSVVYLVHRMAAGPDFRDEDAAGAAAMRDAMAAAGTGRCVFLSGLAPSGGGARPLSRHMVSRLEVEEVLSAGPTPVFTLRAGVVLGAGSTSFEVLRALCELLPIQPLPWWMRRQRVEPVSERDVLEALCHALEGAPGTGHGDLGCGETLTYPELLRRFSRVARTPTIRVPVFGVPWDLVAAGLTPVIAQDPVTVAALVESLHHDMVTAGPSADLVRPGWEMTGIDEAIRVALASTGPAAPGRKGAT